MNDHIITKTTIKRYEVTQIARFLKYDVHKEARTRYSLSLQKTCFKCGHKFQDEEYTYIGMIKGSLNQLFCKDCAEKIAKSLGKEIVILRNE